MKRILLPILLVGLLLLWDVPGSSAAFDERLWEKYAEIKTSLSMTAGDLTALYLDPHQLGETTGRIPFADLRVMTDLKQEIPWQIVSRRPERRTEELPVRMQNLSLTDKRETWLELLVEKEKAHINAVEIMTSDTNFSRQVQVLGSPDGKTWNVLRNDGVIFSTLQGEKLHHTRITFPLTAFRHLALKIANGDAQPIKISSVKALQESYLPGQTYTIDGKAEESTIDPSRRENSVVVRMNRLFPLDRLEITTPERNFQRSVEVQIKRDAGEWEHWTQGTIFSFNTATMRESRLTIDIPEVTAREFRLVFRNMDSPPLSVTGVNGKGYRRLMVFKEQPDRKLYLFFGNPLARMPQYDLAGIVMRQKPEELPVAHLGEIHPNPNFAGSRARLPFTKRYKYLLYVIVLLAVAGLVLLQYRVFRRVGRPPDET